MKSGVAALLLLALVACKKEGQGQQQGAQQNRVVPVITAEVEKRDVPLYLDGLGTIIAYKTVAVRSQVDGRLDQLFFKEGQQVKAGQPIALIDPRPFRIQEQQAHGALARDQALLKAAKLNLQRNKELLDRKLIAPQAVDDQAALVGQYEGAVQVDDAAVNTAKLNLTYARITSPIDGVTGIRNVDPGNFVRASDANGIVTITQLDPVALIFTLPQDVLPQLSAAPQPLEVTAFSRDGAEPLGVGRLELIDNQINQQTATLRLKAVLPNKDRKLWPNQFVKARLKVSVRQGALVVPATALQRGPDGQFVYVVQGDQSVAPKNVQVDRMQGDLAILTGGVQPGDQVVTEGANGLRPGSKVQPQKRGGAGAGPQKQGKPEGAPQPRGRESSR